jgi:hypothetical protein
VDVEGDVVRLEHRSHGSYGNQQIIERVQEAEFQVTGLSGGQGADCPAGTHCRSHDDCAPGLTCLPNAVCGRPP